MTEQKPKNCRCQYPTIKIRNGSGHGQYCPCHKEWLAKGGFRQLDKNKEK